MRKLTKIEIYETQWVTQNVREETNKFWLREERNVNLGFVPRGGGGVLINIDACILAKFNCMVFGELLAASPHALQSYLQSDFEGKVSHYLKKELLRLYDKEKTWRERLWRNGITSSSPMAPRKQPKYVGIEEVFSWFSSYLLITMFWYLALTHLNFFEGSYVHYMPTILVSFCCYLPL